MSRPLPWVASILYVAVLVAGIYYQVAGLASASFGQTAVFVGVLLVLLFGEVLERRRFGSGTPRRVAVVLLAARALLYVVLSIVDQSGSARTLFLLIPFTAYLSLGRRVSYALAVGCLALVVGSVTTTPGWYRDTETVGDLLMFVIGLTFAIAMAAVAAGYVEQAAALAVVTERNRLARDIHDSLGHHLTAVSVQLEKAAAFRHRDEATSAQALADARQSAMLALADVRHSVGTLRTGAPFVLDRAVTELAEAMGDVAVDVSVRGDESRYAGPALVALYRAAQEALTNVRKHAAAGRVSVVVDLGEREARLSVADDGRGFRPAEPSEGFGLRGMRERLDLIGGSVTVDSAEGIGTRLTVLIPRVAR